MVVSPSAPTGDQTPVSSTIGQPIPGAFTPPPPKPVPEYTPEELARFGTLGPDRRGVIRRTLDAIPPIIPPMAKAFPRWSAADLAAGRLKPLLAPGVDPETGESNYTQATAEENANAPIAAKIVAGAQHAAAGAAESAVPFIIGGPAMGGAPLVHRLINLGFSADMLSQVPTAYKGFMQAVKNKDWQSATETLLGGGLGLILGGTGLYHGARPGIAKESPMVNNLLTKRVTEEFTPQELRDVLRRVDASDVETKAAADNERPRDPDIPVATPAEQALARLVSDTPGAAKRGATQTSTESRIQSPFWRKYLGLDEPVASEFKAKGETDATNPESVEGRVPSEPAGVVGERKALTSPELSDRLPGPARKPATTGTSTTPPVIPPKPAIGPIPTAEQLAAMTPDEFPDWRTRTNYTVGSAAKIAAGITQPEKDILESLSKSLLDAYGKGIAKMGKNYSDEEFLRLGKLQMKGQTLREVVRFYNEAHTAEAPTVPERPETIAHQLQMIRDMKRSVVQITDGETIPAIPKGMKAVPVPDHGVFIYDPNRMVPKAITDAVKDDTIGHLLGYGIARKPAKGTEIGAWVVRDPNGVEKHCVLTDKEHSAAVEKAARSMMSAGDTIALEPEAEVIARRKSPVKPAVSTGKTNPRPTPAQTEAGNYEKRQLKVHGLDISVENEKGSIRRSKPGQPPWEVTMPSAYGYIKGTVGKDKDHLDVYVGPHPEGDRVFVIDQKNLTTGKFDEHKVMLGFDEPSSAVDAYKGAFSDGSGLARIMNMTPMSVVEFKEWMKNGDMKKPVFQRPRVVVNLPVKDEKSGLALVDGLNASNPDFEAKMEKRGKSKIVITVNGDAEQAKPEPVAEPPVVVQLRKGIDAYEKGGLTDMERDNALSTMQQWIAQADKHGVVIPQEILDRLNNHIESRQKEIRGDTKSPVTKIKQVSEPEKFESVDALLAFRKTRLSEERELYKEQIGISTDQSERLQSLLARDADTARFEKTLTPDQLKRFNEFFDGPFNQKEGPWQSWETDPRLSPEEIAHETDTQLLASALVTAVQRGVEEKANNDRFISAAIAARRLQELGKTKSDIARYLDDYTTRNSGSQGDKAEFFKSLGTKVNTFLQRQGIELPDGELARKQLPPTGKTPESASIIVQVKSHRARDRMQSAIGDIGTNLLPADLSPGEFYAVTPSELEKIKDIPSISKSSRRPSDLRTASFGGEGFDAKQKEARRRLSEAGQLNEFEISQLSRLRLKRDQGRKLTDGQKETLATLESRVPSEAHAIAAARSETAGQPAVAQASLSDESLGAADQSGGTGENPAESFLRANVSSDPSLAQGADGRRRQSAVLSKWATENGLILTAPKESYGSQLETRTSEHYVVGDPKGQRVVKWTYPGTFGHSPTKTYSGVGREPASPLQYLQRIRWQNSIFGDDIKVLGFQMFGDKEFMGRPGGLSIVTSQPYIKAADPKNPNPSHKEIEDYMASLGFEPVTLAGAEMMAWTRSDGTIVSDARPDNFVNTDKGVVPIDLQVSQPNQSSLATEESAPVEQPAPVQKAHSAEQLLALLPHSGLSPQAEALTREMLKMPVIAKLPQFTTVIADLLNSGFQGSQLGTLIELARNADPLTGPHELLHLVWDHLMPDDLKAEFERLRVASLNDLIAEAQAAGKVETVKALTDIRDNPTSGGQEFLARNYPVAVRNTLYPFSSAEEFFTHSGSTRFKQRVGSTVESFWDRVKAIIGDFFRTIKRALRFRRNQQEIIDDIIEGRFEPAGPEDAARGERERQASLTPEQAAEMADDEGLGYTPTQIFGKRFGVLSRPHITPETTAASSQLAKQMLDDAGIPAVEQDVQDDDASGARRGWVMQPQGHDMTPQGRMLVERLKKEIAAQYETGKLADHLANIINSIRLNAFVLPENGIRTAMEEMNSSVRLELGQIAQSEGSFRGQALNALRGYTKDLTVIGRNLDIELGRIWSDAFGGDDLRSILDELETAKQRGDDLEKALDDLLEKTNRKMRKKYGASTALGRKIIEMVRAGPGEPWELLREIARQRWGTVPTDEQLAKVKQTVNQAEALLKLSPQEEADAGANEEDLKKAMDDRRLATESRRTELMKDVRLAVARWTRPLNWSRYWLTPKNNAAAINEYGVANVLFKAGFMGFRLSTHLSTQFFAVHMPSRALASAQQNARDLADKRIDYSLWKLAHEAFSDQTKGLIEAVRPAARRFEAAMMGRGPGRNADALTTGIMIFERIQAKAAEYHAKGEYGKALVTWLVGLPKFSLRFLDGLDRMQGTAVEFGELRHQARQWMRENGMNEAQIVAQLDTLLSGLSQKRDLAMADAAAMLQASGVPFTPAKLAETAWELVIGRMYQDMARLGMPTDDFRTQNDYLMKTVAWQHPVRTGPGGMVAMVAKGARGMMGNAGIPSFFLNFGNAIGTGLNYALQNTPLYATTAWQIPGYSKGESPHFATEKDRLQRRWQALMGTIMGALILEAIRQGLIKVWQHAPTDKKERAIWEAQGHRVGTAEIRLNDHEVSVLSLAVGPGALYSPYLAAGGALFDAADRRAKAQLKMNAEAEKLGLTPGKVAPLDGVDMAAIFGEALWGTLMGNKALSGIVQSGSEYGVPNIKKMLASQVSPLIVGLPAFQEVERGLGANLDPHLATFWDYLVPLSTSGARAVNMLGDPVGTPDAVQRMIQTMTAGSYPLVDLDQAKANPAYAALMASGYRPPTINPNKGYAINGEFRPFTDKELAAYTVARGQALKQNLADLGPDATFQGAQQAYQRANDEALESVGAAIPSRTGGGQRVASQGTPATSGLSGTSSGRLAVRTGPAGVQAGIRAPSTHARSGAGARVPVRRTLGVGLPKGPSMRPGRGLHLPAPKYGRVPGLRRR